MLFLKNVYKIPYNLDKSDLDREFQFQKDGVRFTRNPVTLLTIVVWTVTVLVLMYFLFKSFIGSSFVGAIIFSIGWLGIGIIAAMQDDSHRYKLMVFYKYFIYLNKDTRRVSLLRNTKLSKAISEFGVASVVTDGIDEGLITMSDGSYAKMFYIVGSVSALMFEEDQQAILSANSKFYRGIDANVDFIFDTVSAKQTVDRPLENISNKRARQRNPLLKELYDEDEYIMKVIVGGYLSDNATYEEMVNSDTSGFRSSKQTLMVIGSTKDDLRRGIESVYADANSDGYMFKYVRPLTYKEVEDYYKSFLN